ncbi:unnamed protein product, partial [Mesorhabditis spiculigera]
MMSSSDDEEIASPKRQVFATKHKKRKDVVFYTHFEEVLQKINPFGPYQIFCCIVILYASIEWAGNSSFMYLLGSLEPDWNCTYANGTTGVVKASTSEGKNCDDLKQCVSFKAIVDSVEFRSLVADFKLVCDDSDKVKWIEVIQAGGSLIGSVIGGHLGDHLGRRTIFFSGQLTIIITSMMCTAARNWYAYASIMGFNCFLYGIIEVTSLTMMMEYTSNKFRIIHTGAFQWPFAYMTIALIAYLTKDWQNFFIWLNLVACPLAIAFMLFLESPRWLIAKNNLNKACDVLNDIGHRRWNNAKVRFTTHDLSSIHKKEEQPFYNFFHLFSTMRLAKQSVMQIVSMLTYAMVSNTYLYTVQGMHDSTIMFTFLDGAFRLPTPFIIIFLDIYFPKFGRKLQFILSLVIELILFGVVIGLVATGTSYQDVSITIIVIVATMINDCVFWMNIVQITTQRYPTVIRCIAFGSLHGVKHIGAIIGFLVLRPLLDTDGRTWLAFAIPEAMLLGTLVLGIFLQPETKGKAMMDQMVESNYGKLENELPRALMRLAAGHKVRQIEIRDQLRQKYAEAQDAEIRGKRADKTNPFVFKGQGQNGQVNQAFIPEQAPPRRPEYRMRDDDSHRSSTHM